ncbi:uroporphyrinogen decarboxylase, partial [Stomatohabitans albus]
MQPPIIAQIKGQPSAHRPIWFMRQAGRSLPEYRDLRANIPMLDSCLNPEVAAEITCQPVRRHKVDAAVFFSDIMVPLKLAGIDVHIEPGVGPVLDKPILTMADVSALETHHLEGEEVITQGVQLVTEELGRPDGTAPYTPVIGFAGAPFTLAAYMVEGRPSRDHLAARTMMYADPVAWHALLDWCARISADFVRAQIAGGASIIQLFDSWAGSLGQANYVAHVVDHSATVLQAAHEAGVPTIHFGTGTNEFLPEMRDAGADVVGVDHRIALDEADRRLGHTVTLQGNI